jgi:diguanylate cyclase (GGDEF)-like protein
VAALEQKLDLARAGGPESRRQRRRRNWVLGAAASYAADTLFLGLFAAAGTVAGSVAAVYGAIAALTSCFFFVALGRANREAAKDPGLVVPQAFIGVMLQLIVPAMAPQITFPYLANLLTVFAFVMIWLPLATAVTLWVAATVLSGALMYMLGARIGVPTGSAFELLLVWLFFSLILGRCVFLSIYAAGMRSRLAESMARAQDLATHDELTLALNRRALMERLEQERARFVRGGPPFCVAVLDLDHFKAVNDTHGHPAGDAVLARFADVVRATMRESDIFGRHGGEEFMLIMVGTQIGPAAAALERIRAAVDAHEWSALAPGLRMTVSAGVAEFPREGSVDEVVRTADGAMYEAKRAGRNKVCTA